MNEPPRVALHTLNAVRVIAEYIVVHCHMSILFPREDGLFSASAATGNLMSFFFVLSGFVAAYTNLHVDFTDTSNALAYIKKRFSKTYHVYFGMFLLDLPGAIISQYQPGCALFWLSFVSQPILLHSWLGIQHIGISNGVGWYLCTLYWLWMAFPFLRVDKMFSTRAWFKICILYLSSVCLWLSLAPYNMAYTRAVPVFRIFEFLMGCGVAFTLKTTLHGAFVFVGLVAFFAYCIIDYEDPSRWENEGLYGNCTMWIKRHDQRLTPTVIPSKFSILWAGLIHWLASTELSETPNFVVRLLQYDFFKYMSSFSLHVYLSHYAVAHGIHSVFMRMGAFGLWDFDTMIIACYTVAYTMSVWETTILNKIFCVSKTAEV